MAESLWRCFCISPSQFCVLPQNSSIGHIISTLPPIIRGNEQKSVRPMGVPREKQIPEPNDTASELSVCLCLSYPLACHCQCHACHPSVGRIGPLEIVVLREVPQLLLDLRPPVCVNAVIAPPWRRVSYALETAMRAPPGGLLVVPTNPDAKRVPQSRQVAVGFAALGTANLQFRNHRRSTATECHEY